MDALAGYGSDSSSDNEDNPQQANAILSLADYGDEDNSADELGPPQKRSKQEEETFKKETSDTPLLPRPPLGTESIIQSEIDRFTPRYGFPQWKATIPAKLRQLSSSKQTTNWAQQLKSQNEFHNPAFFQTVVQHFGIKDKLGSNISCQDHFHDYELDLVRLEEEARVRQQQESQPALAAPTEYAQQQLERVMQIHTSKR